MRDLIIIGAGGFGAEVAWVVREISAAADGGAAGWKLVGFADGDPGKRHKLHGGYRVLGTIEESAEELGNGEVWFFCAIGDNAARSRAVESARFARWRPATLVHPSAIIADTARVSPGSYVGPASIVSNNACVGEHVIINMHVSVGHDATVSDFCQLSPGSRVSGFCSIEEAALVGSNAVLTPGTRVGRGAVVGASSLAHGQIDAGTTVLGVPARVVRLRVTDLLGPK